MLTKKKMVEGKQKMVYISQPRSVLDSVESSMSELMASFDLMTLQLPRSVMDHVTIVYQLVLDNLFALRECIVDAPPESTIQNSRPNSVRRHPDGPVGEEQ